MKQSEGGKQMQPGKRVEMSRERGRARHAERRDHRKDHIFFPSYRVCRGWVFHGMVMVGAWQW